MNRSYLFTSESVSEGHPDKVCDRISDMVVDTYMSSGDPQTRVACETLTTTNKVVLAGEVRGPSISKDQKVKTKEIENLTIDQLMNLSNSPKTTIKNKIQKNIKESELNKMIKLPEIIVEDKNAYVGASVVSIPNFVTERNITGKILFLDNKIDNNLDNKIILLENADPGFDFIFSFKINGLITKYGGANSHMTIRCNELNIPAAIGCGEAIFEKIKRSEKINLNCKNLLIREL